MLWHAVQLTPAQVGDNEHSRIQAKFEIFFAQAGGPRDMAMFSGWDMGDVPALNLYFTPETKKHAEPFLLAVGAKPCARPSDVDVLSAGPADALQRFRHEQL